MAARTLRIGMSTIGVYEVMKKSNRVQASFLAMGLAKKSSQLDDESSKLSPRPSD